MALRQATLVFLLKDKQILLAMKKRGFGVGHWNGVGGKPEKGEAIEDTAVRECQEEIGVTPKNLQHMATLNFYFPADKAKEGWNQQVLVYLAQEWDGEPAETEEMAPKWFRQSKLPFDQMWEDDRFWLPAVLRGVHVEGDFTFGEDGHLEDYKITAK